MSLWSTYRTARLAVSRLILHVLSLLLTSRVAYDGWRLHDPIQLALGGGMVLAALFLCVNFKPVNILVTFLAWGTLGGALVYIRSLDSKAFRPIAAISKNVALARRNESPITITGRVVIWDVQTNKLSPAHFRLPYPLRAKADDQSITVFMLWNVRSEFVWKYHNKSPATSTVKIDAAGYRDTADFAVVRWPEQTLVSWHSLAGAMPPREISVDQKHAHDPVHGDWQEPLAQWITALPGGENAEVEPLHQWTQAEAQAEALRRYPQLGQLNSPLNHAFVDKYQHLKDSNSGQLKDPAWPIHLARDLSQ